MGKAALLQVVAAPNTLRNTAMRKAPAMRPQNAMRQSVAGQSEAEDALHKPRPGWWGGALVGWLAGCLAVRLPSW